MILAWARPAMVERSGPWVPARRALAGGSPQPQRRGTILHMIATRTEAASATGRARRLFPREDYHAMGRMGVLRPDERVELIEGEIIVMSPAGIRHSILRAAVERSVQHRAFVRTCPRTSAEFHGRLQPLGAGTRRDAAGLPGGPLRLAAPVAGRHTPPHRILRFPANVRPRNQAAVVRRVRNPRGVNRRSAARRDRIPP